MKGKHSLNTKKTKSVKNNNIPKDKKIHRNEKLQKNENMYRNEKLHKNTKVHKNENLYKNGKEKINNNSKYKSKGKKKKKSALRVLAKIFIVLLIILVILFTSVYIFMKNKLGKMNYVELNEEELGINQEIDESLKGIRNIVLLGVDSRNMDNIKGSRTDSIIIVSINEDTKEVNLISIYRDTYMDIEGYGLDKITHAHAYGGPALTINTLNRNLDLNIKEFATVNFKVVAELIDEMGGIEIDVKESEISEMNKYISDTSKNTGIESSKITKSGLQTLDGVQAVTYSRIRKNTGGDEKRSERMRTVLVKVYEKAKKMNIGEINDIANEILPNIQTNISSDEILGLIPQMATYKIKESTGWPYENKGIRLDRWYGVPVTLSSNVTKLHKEVLNQEDYTPSETVEAINSAIIKKTGYSGK